jgi:hypothetical protein
VAAPGRILDIIWKFLHALMSIRILPNHISDSGVFKPTWEGRRMIILPKLPIFTRNKSTALINNH